MKESLKNTNKEGKTAHLLIQEFRHNVLCSRDTNQHKASKILVELKELISLQDYYSLNDCFVHAFEDTNKTIEEKGSYIKKIEDKYE